MKRLSANLLLLLLGSAPLFAQRESPVITGGAAFVSTTDGGATFVQPILAPVALVPIGDKLLVESRADLRSVTFRSNGTSGPWETQRFATLEYLQLDYFATPSLTITAGRFVTPFGIYNERLTPVWIRNLQQAPIIFGFGTRTTGSSDGGMVRGVFGSDSSVQLNYTGYVSAGSGVNKFEAGRVAGGRLGIFVPSQRLEIGASYQRYLQDTRQNVVGAHLAWRPVQVPLDVKGEFARSPSGYGYWLETALAPPDSSAAWYRRFQPVARAQQFVRKKLIMGDALPGRNTQQTDFGLNFYMPHEVRLQSSYGRTFSVAGNRNVWTVGITYRFLFPLMKGAQ